MNKIVKSVVAIFITYTSSIYAGTFTPEIDLLLWHASQEPTSTWASIVSVSSDHTTKFQATNVNFDWDLGVKFGTSYTETKGSLESGLYWTYFQANTSSTVNNAAQLVFPEFFSGFISGNFFFGGNLNWRLTLNMLDIVFAKNIVINDRFSFKPQVGIKGGTIYQKIDTNWNAIAYVANEKVTNNFIGTGPSFGINTHWQMNQDLALVGNFATAFLWGNWQVKDQYVRPNVSGVVTPTVITTNMHSSQLGTMMFDYYLAVEWWLMRKPNLKIQLGYEMQWWANQVRIVTFQQLPVHGDLTLQGGTCRIILDL